MHVRTIASVGYLRKFHNATGIRLILTHSRWTLSHAASLFCCPAANCLSALQPSILIRVPLPLPDTARFHVQESFVWFRAKTDSSALAAYPHSAILCFGGLSLSLVVWTSSRYPLDLGWYAVKSNQAILYISTMLRIIHVRFSWLKRDEINIELSKFLLTLYHRMYWWILLKSSFLHSNLVLFRFGFVRVFVGLFVCYWLRLFH